MKRRRVTAAAGALLLLTCPLHAEAVPDDVQQLQSFLLRGQFTAERQPENCDRSGDGVLNAIDLTLMKRALLTEPGDTRGLVWQDEFDGDALDPAKWAYELGNWKLDADGNYITGGWGNNEQQFYTDKNASVHDGILTIAARHEAYTDAVQGSYDYTSARLSTQHLFSACGGRIEVRARCDAGKSLWPAIWMLPEDSVYGGWAASGEIDIMEGWGSRPQEICGTIHFGDAWPDNRYLTADYKFPAGTTAADWHTYAIEWTSGEIRWYVDDVLYSTQTDWESVGYPYPAPFDQNFYLILNLAVGGQFDGVDGIYGDPATFADGEKHFEIDYVRVYEPETAFAPSESKSLPLELYTEGSDAGMRNRSCGTDISVNNCGALEYAVMGLVHGRNVRAGETYTLSFDASATAARDMIVTVEDAAYTRYLDEQITLTTEPKHYSFSVTFSEDMQADLKFQLGNIGNAAACGAHSVKLENIAWEMQQ